VGSSTENNAIRSHVHYLHSAICNAAGLPVQLNPVSPPSCLPYREPSAECKPFGCTVVTTVYKWLPPALVCPESQQPWMRASVELTVPSSIVTMSVCSQSGQLLGSVVRQSVLQHCLTLQHSSLRQNVLSGGTSVVGECCLVMPEAQGGRKTRLLVSECWCR
jgi:hypothetical protein